MNPLDTMASVVAAFPPVRYEDTGGGCMVAFYRAPNGGMVTFGDETIATWDTFAPDMIGDGGWVDEHWIGSYTWDNRRDLVTMLIRATETGIL